jgi:hypothetical protein
MKRVVIISCLLIASAMAGAQNIDSLMVISNMFHTMTSRIGIMQ